MTKKSLSLFIALIMIVSVLPTGAINVYAGDVKDKLDIVVSRYPNGSRWTDSFDGGKQCYGFAKMVIYNVFGKSGGSYRTWRYDGTPTIGMTVIGSITSFSSSNVQSLLNKAKPGDVLQFNTTKQHSMIVYSVVSDGVNIYDCNWDNNCGISKRKCSFGAWSGRNSSKLTLLRASNYSNIDGVSHTVNTNYGKNFTAYPKAKITASNIFDANHNQYSSTAWIGTSDKCTIHEVYTDGCCKVTYPISSGTVTAYSKISLFNTHTHNYTGARLYESEHPHAISQRCTDYSSCGGYYWTGEYKKVSTCEKCWNLDWNCSESSIKLKTGESKTITISIDSNTACYPAGSKIKYDYDTSIISMTQNGTAFTFTGKKAGSCTFTVNAYTDDTFSKKISSFKIPVAVDTQTYTVSYNANGGIGAPASQTKVYGQALTLSSNKPSKEGYIFAGWSKVNPPTGGQYSAGDSYTDNSSVTLYAYWKPIEYVVRFISNDGNGYGDHARYTYDQSSALISNKFTRTGYTFKNWNTEPDGSGVSYSDKQVIKNLCNTYNDIFVLYAQWTPNTYTVTYNANGGSGAPSSQTKIYGQTLKLSSAQPTRSGYTFLGWSTSSTATSPTHSASGNYNNNESVTLYAVWDKIHVHSYSTKTTPATCTSTGLMVSSCDGCGLISKTEVIDKIAHKAVTDKAVAPTCTTTGLTQGSHCAVCNAILVEQKELIAEHQWNDGIVSKRATCVSNGTKSITCLLCGETKNELILAEGHNYQSKVVKPTCTTKGYTEYICLSCGDNFNDDYVPATEHTAIPISAVAPTCTSTGLTEGSKCSVCGEIITAQKTVAKLPHTLETDVTKATLSKDGNSIEKCTDCGTVISTKTIAKPSAINLSATTYTYDGKVKTPAVTVKDAKGKTLVKNTDYTVTYASGRKLVGKYAVKITFKGNYSGTKTLYFTIRPKNTSISGITAGSKKFTVKLKKYTTQTTGYQIQYSTNAKFTSAKTVAMKNTTTSKTISKLTGGKKYYVRVRTYKTVKINGKNTNIYSAWSSAKAVTTKK